MSLIISETYDVVTGAGVFIPQHITADAFDEINRVLKPSKNILRTQKQYYINA